MGSTMKEPDCPDDWSQMEWTRGGRSLDCTGFHAPPVPPEKKTNVLDDTLEEL